MNTIGIDYNLDRPRMFYYLRTAEVKKLFQVISAAMVGWLVTVIL